MVKKLVLIFLILMQQVYAQTFFQKYYREIYSATFLAGAFVILLLGRQNAFLKARDAWRQEHQDLDFKITCADASTQTDQ